MTRPLPPLPELPPPRRPRVSKTWRLPDDLVAALEDVRQQYAREQGDCTETDVAEVVLRAGLRSLGR